PGSVASNVVTLTVQGRPLIWSARLNVDPAGVLGVFTVEGGAKRLLLRAIGPTLEAFGVSDALADPQLAIFDVNAQPVASNDNWGTLPDTAGVTATMAAAGAFALSPASKDAVLIATLAPGTYVARMSPPVPGGHLALLALY